MPSKTRNENETRNTKDQNHLFSLALSSQTGESELKWFLYIFIDWSHSQWLWVWLAVVDAVDWQKSWFLTAAIGRNVLMSNEKIMRRICHIEKNFRFSSEEKVSPQIKCHKLWLSCLRVCECVNGIQNDVHCVCGCNHFIHVRLPVHAHAVRYGTNVRMEWEVNIKHWVMSVILVNAPTHSIDDDSFDVKLVVLVGEKKNIFFVFNIK